MENFDRENIDELLEIRQIRQYFPRQNFVPYTVRPAQNNYNYYHHPTMDLLHRTVYIVINVFPNIPLGHRWGYNWYVTYHVVKCPMAARAIIKIKPPTWT